MSKRGKEEEVLTSDEYKYKKSHGCLKAFIICTVIFVLLIGTIFGGVYYAWGRFVEPQTDLTFQDGISIISSLYGAKEDEIITNSYDAETDKLKFYDGFKENLYLHKETDIGIQDIVNIALPGDPNANPNQDQIPSSGDVPVAGPLAENVGMQVVPTSTGNEALDEILDKIHFDFSSLKTYTGTAAEKKVLHIKDKEFAAVLNEAFEYFGTDDAAAKIPQIANYQQYFKHIHIGQILIDSTLKGSVETTKLQLVIKVDSKDLVGDVLEGAGLPGFVKPLIKMCVPKKLFLGMNVYPDKVNEEATVVINSLKEELAVKLMNAVGKISGKTGEESITTVINNKVCDIVAKINSKIPLYFTDSDCNIEPIEGLMRLLKVDITEAQFLGMIRDIKLPTPEEIKLVLGKVETKVSTILDEKLRTDAVTNFIDSFTQKIAFNNKDAAGNAIITPDNVFEKVGALTKDETMLQNIDFAQLDYTQEGQVYNEDKYKIEAEYMAVAGLINSSINKPQEPGPTPENVPTAEASEPAAKKKIPVKILTFNYIPTGDMIQVVAALEITKFVEESLQGKDNSEIMIKFAKEFLPEAIYFKIGLAQDETAGIPPMIELNSLNAEETANLLDVIGKLAVSLGAGGQDFDITKLSLELEKAVRDNLTKINETLGSEIKFTEDRGCLIPSIFEIVSGLKMFRDEVTGEKTMTSQSVHNIFRDVYQYNPEYEYTGSEAVHNPNRLNIANVTAATVTADEITNKFFLDNIPSDATLFNKLTTLKTTFADDLNVERMVNTDKQLNELKPAIPENELGFLINGTGKLNNVVAQLKDTHIIRTVITKASETAPVMFELEIEGTINLEGENAKYAAILPSKIYVKVSSNADRLLEKIKSPVLPVDPNAPIDPSTVYTKVQITKMDTATMDTFGQMITSISKKEFNVLKLENSVQQNLEKTLREVMYGKSAEASQSKINIVFEPQKASEVGKLKIDTTIYDVAVGEIFKDKPEEEKVSAEVLKKNLENAHKIPTVVNNIAADTTRVETEELMGKYYVDVTKQAGTLIDKIKGIKSSYFESISGVDMAKDNRPLEELELLIGAGEFGNIIADKVNVKINNIKNLVMQNVLIKDADLLVITYTGEIDKDKIGGGTTPPEPGEPISPTSATILNAGEGTEGDAPAKNTLYDKMLPDSLTIKIEINKGLILALKEGVEVPAGAVTAYINSIDDLNEFGKIFSAITKKSLNVKEANDKAARDIQKVFIELKNDVDMRFEDAATSGDPNGAVRIGNIFDLALTQIYTDRSNPSEPVINNPNNITATDLRNALKNMFNGGVPQMGATTGAEILLEQNKITNITQTPLPPNGINVSATLDSVISDANILNKLTTGTFDINAAFHTTSSQIKQVLLVSKDNVDDNLTAAYGNIFRANDGDVPTYKNSLLITVSVNLREMLNKNNAKLLPENPVDITMVIDLEDAAKVGIQINTMNKKEALAIQDIFGKHKGTGGGMNSEKIQEIATKLLGTEIINTSVSVQEHNVPFVLTLQQILDIINKDGTGSVKNGTPNDLLTGYYGYIEITKVLSQTITL